MTEHLTTINLFYPLIFTTIIIIFIIIALVSTNIVDKIKFLKPIFFKNTDTIHAMFNKTTDDFKEMFNNGIREVKFTNKHEFELHDIEQRLKKIESKFNIE